MELDSVLKKLRKLQKLYEGAKKVTNKIRGRRGAKRSAIGRMNMSIAAKKSWKNAESRRKKVSNAISEYMRNGGAKKLSNERKGKKFSIETRMKNIKKSC